MHCIPWETLLPTDWASEVEKMHFLLVLAFAAVLLATDANSAGLRSHTELADLEWEAFKIQHGKKYNSHSEEQHRRNIHSVNMRKIAEHNAKGVHSFTLKMYHFGDLLKDEFNSLFNGLQVPENFTQDKSAVLEERIFFPSDDIEIPNSVDWRERGYVTPVKNQKDCGSCWAFAATGALEGQIFRKTGKLISFSEQNLVDCSWMLGNQGCDGGFPHSAFKYIFKNHGIDTEESYPYEAKDARCRYRVGDSSGYDDGIMYVESGDEEMLKIALATVGPIAVLIDSTDLLFYSSGIYHNLFCMNTLEDMNHAVLAVGYGSENGTDYWILKNSWGEDWGEAGYFRLVRNANNQCGVAIAPSYPVV